MKRSSKVSQKHRHAAESPAVGVQIEIKCRVLREIRKHARSSMNVEICGVLVGARNGEKTVVDASIPGEEARQGGSHVTFTQETWTHIYQVKDSRFPDKRIVGWYHSHPGFGIFLSEHDTFIHRNFFSDPSQIAWVYDPHSDEEGCFAWEHGDIKRLDAITLRDEPCESGGTGDHRPSEYVGEEPEQPGPEPGGRRARIVRWVALILSHAFALLLGLVVGALLTPRVIVIPDRTGSRPAILSPPHPSRSAASEEGRKK
ncbi:MAG: Mov34/MPN/PAD-1 family protein [Acidobacteria bacterium]|nr:Mov34/MPN/PAD-1 family protein [Acidobacteriota bacterium]